MVPPVARVLLVLVKQAEPSPTTSLTSNSKRKNNVSNGRNGLISRFEEGETHLVLFFLL
jgi:hypothetical protein